MKVLANTDFIKIQEPKVTWQDISSGCPWKNSDYCLAIMIGNDFCREDNCAPYYFINNNINNIKIK